MQLVQNQELQALAASTLGLVRTNSSTTELVSRLLGRSARTVAWSSADSWQVPRSNVTYGLSRQAIVTDFCSSLRWLSATAFME